MYPAAKMAFDALLRDIQSSTLASTKINCYNYGLTDADVEKLMTALAENPKVAAKITELDLGNNDLTIPPILDGLTALQTLVLNHNKLTTPPKFDGLGLTALYMISLSHNQLTTPTILDELPALQIIYLRENQFTTPPILTVPNHELMINIGIENFSTLGILMTYRLLQFANVRVDTHGEDITIEIPSTEDITKYFDQYVHNASQIMSSKIDSHFRETMQIGLLPLPNEAKNQIGSYLLFSENGEASLATVIAEIHKESERLQAFLAPTEGLEHELYEMLDATVTAIRVVTTQVCEQLMKKSKGIAESTDKQRMNLFKSPQYSIHVNLESLAKLHLQKSKESDDPKKPKM